MASRRVEIEGVLDEAKGYIASYRENLYRQDGNYRSNYEHLWE
jgi:hypothetical protein